VVANVESRDEEFRIQQAMERVWVVQGETINEVRLQDAHGIVAKTELWPVAFLELANIQAPVNEKVDTSMPTPCPISQTNVNGNRHILFALGQINHTQNKYVVALKGTNAADVHANNLLFVEVLSYLKRSTFGFALI
jgi:hypothetical protein